MKVKLDAKAERLVLLQQAKINTMKTLRKFTHFSKSNYEDLIKENFDLKTQVVELDHQIKILKVAIIKLRNLLVKNSQMKSPNLSDSFDPITKLVPQSLADGCQSPGKNKGQWSRLAGKTNSKNEMSASTKASDSLEERLSMELASLKREMLQKEQDFKIQMSRMKTFYDKHLLELNQMKLKKPAVEQKTEEVNREHVKVKQEQELKRLRSSLLVARDRERRLEECVEEKEDKIRELKSRIANQGVTKLSETIESLKREIDRLKSSVAEKDRQLVEVDSFDYQTKKQFGDHDGKKVTSIVRFYFKVKDSGLLPAVIEIIKPVCDWLCSTTLARCSIDLRNIYLLFREQCLAKVVDVEADLLQLANTLVSSQGHTTTGQIGCLKQEVDDLQQQLADERLRVEMMLRTGGQVNDFATSSSRFKVMAADYRQMEEELKLETEMPDHIKEEVRRIRLQNFKAKVCTGYQDSIE